MKRAHNQGFTNSEKKKEDLFKIWKARDLGLIDDTSFHNMVGRMFWREMIDVTFKQEELDFLIRKYGTLREKVLRFMVRPETTFEALMRIEKKLIVEEKTC